MQPSNLRGSRALELFSASLLLLFAAIFVFLFDVLTVGGRVGFAFALAVCCGALIAIKGKQAISFRLSASTVATAFATVWHVETFDTLFRHVPDQIAGAFVFIILPFAIWLGGFWALVEFFRSRAIQFVFEFLLLAATGLAFYSSEFP